MLRSTVSVGDPVIEAARILWTTENTLIRARRRTFTYKAPPHI